MVELLWQWDCFQLVVYRATNQAITHSAVGSLGRISNAKDQTPGDTKAIAFRGKRNLGPERRIGMGVVEVRHSILVPAVPGHQAKAHTASRLCRFFSYQLYSSGIGLLTVLLVCLTFSGCAALSLPGASFSTQEQKGHLFASTSFGLFGNI